MKKVLFPSKYDKPITAAHLVDILDKISLKDLSREELIATVVVKETILKIIDRVIDGR